MLLGDCDVAYFFIIVSTFICIADCLPDRICQSASSVVMALPLPSSLSCFVSLHNLIPSFSRLSDAVLYLQHFLLACHLYRRNLVLVCCRWLWLSCDGLVSASLLAADNSSIQLFTPVWLVVLSGSPGYGHVCSCQYTCIEVFPFYNFGYVCALDTDVFSDLVGQ